MDCRIKTLGN